MNHNQLTISEQLLEFIQSNQRNSWLDDGILMIFVRKGRHAVLGNIINTLDIANIRSITSEYEHKGYFKTFMETAESTGLPIYVENITNPRLVYILEKNGYTIITEYFSTNAVKNF